MYFEGSTFIYVLTPASGAPVGGRVGGFVPDRELRSGIRDHGGGRQQAPDISHFLIGPFAEPTRPDSPVEPMLASTPSRKEAPDRVGRLPF